MQIKNIAVLGSGVMGGAIAAHAANAGLNVLLLDIVLPAEPNKNKLSEDALARMLKANPSPFAHPDAAKKVYCGNLEDDLKKLADADWIIEAVLEKLEVKQDVYRKIDSVRKHGSVVSSNTSTLPLRKLVKGMPAQFAADFCIAHFFNPVRFMRLLEMLPSETMEKQRFADLCEFADIYLGKEVIKCKDTPGFIANRIGVYFMTLAMNEALQEGLDVEAIDAAMSRPYGIPKTGVFGLYDLIGIDLMPLIAKAMVDNIPASDPFAKLNPKPKLLEKLISEGYTGRKGKGGFYRILREGDKKIKQVLDLKTGEYRAEKPAKEIGSREAEFAKNIIQKTIDYANTLFPEIAYSKDDIDLAMQAGYSWKNGLFSLAHEKPFLPSLKRDYLTFDSLKKSPPVKSTHSASLWDAGENIFVFEIKTKMNAFDENVFDALESALESNPRALIIAAEGEVFSAGANLKQMLEWTETGDLQHVSKFIARGQSVMMKLKSANFLTIAALSGIALGGGCETILHTQHVQAYIESTPGLVEVNVGLIPAWGGTKEMLLRHTDRKAAFKQILSATTAGSSLLARDLKYLKTGDAITMNRSRLLADAVNIALVATPLKYQSQKVTSKNVSIEELLESVNFPSLTPHQSHIAKVLAEVFSFSGSLSEQEILDRELAAFLELISTKSSQERISHMLNTGKPLIN